MLAFLLACGSCGSADPREAILARFPAEVLVTQEPGIALREEKPAIACLGFQNQLRKDPWGEKSEALWAGLLVASARATCLSVEDGDVLAAWSEKREPGIWAGARAEWFLKRGKEEEAKALLPTISPDARLRIAMQLGLGQEAFDAAEDVLIQWPGTLVACRVLVTNDMQRNDLFRAVEDAGCNKVDSPDLQRLAGVAMDLGGDTAGAEKKFRDARAFVHLAALLYQSPTTPERTQEAQKLLSSDEAPPALLHRAWMFLLGRGPALTEEQLGLLNGNPDAAVVQAALRMESLGPDDVDAIGNLPGAAPLILQARIATLQGDVGIAKTALERAKQREPYFEPVFRSIVGGMLDLGMDPAPALAWWESLDPDHIRLRGSLDRREVVWEVVAPWTWEEIMERRPGTKKPVPSGKDAVGDAFRAAMALPDRNSRLDALTELQRQNPDLRELARIRYQIESGVLDSERNTQ